jgi:hypothetical protein
VYPALVVVVLLLLALYHSSYAMAIITIILHTFLRAWIGQLLASAIAL